MTDEQTNDEQVSSSEHVAETTEVTPDVSGAPNGAGGTNVPPVESSTPVRNLTPDPEPDTFPREYVEQLRQEAAEARVKAKDRDTLAERLHVALVAATGRMADPTDLPFDQAHLDDPEALTAAVDELLERKPHLANRRFVGGIGQGASTGTEPVSLAGILRANAT